MTTGTVVVLVVGLVVNGFLSHIVGETARRKEIGYDKAFFLSFLFSPFIGLLISMASPMKEESVIETKVIETKEEDSESYTPYVVALVLILIISFFLTIS